MKYGKNSKKDKYAIHEVQMNLEKTRRLMKRITTTTTTKQAN